jgi:hypothetical protein
LGSAIGAGALPEPPPTAGATEFFDKFKGGVGVYLLAQLGFEIGQSQRQKTHRLSQMSGRLGTEILKMVDKHISNLWQYSGCEKIGQSF